jgi:uncharacterized protein (TIGR02118 family)
MAKVIVIYDEPKDKDGFESYYNNTHIPLVKTIPNLRGATINRVVQGLNTEKNVYLVAELEFEDLDTLNQAMASEKGQEVQVDVANLVPFLNRPPVILITA